jgi:pilus assembly protein CpaE
LPDLDDAGLVTLESTLGASPSTWMILLSPVQSPEFQLRAMRAGVREVLRSPLADGELRAACDRLLGRIAALRGGAARVGKVLAFLPAKGGSGSTFLATNLAYALAVRGQRVALLDLNLQFGDASLFLTETRSTRTIVELARDVSRIDGAFLESSMLQVSPTLWMLPAPDTPRPRST